MLDGFDDIRFVLVAPAMLSMPYAGNSGIQHVSFFVFEMLLVLVAIVCGITFEPIISKTKIDTKSAKKHLLNRLIIGFCIYLVLIGVYLSLLFMYRMEITDFAPLETIGVFQGVQTLILLFSILRTKKINVQNIN